MSTQAQIDADAALARRLQEEEFATQLPYMEWPSPSSPSPPPPPPPRPYRSHLPSYPQPTHEWPQPSQPAARAQAAPSAAAREQRFPFVSRRATFGAADVLTDLFRHIAESGDPRRSAAATDGLSELGDFPGSTYVRRDGARATRAPPSSATASRRTAGHTGSGSATSAGSSADGALNSILQHTFGRMDDAVFGGGGTFTVTPDGVQFEHVRTPGGAHVAFAHGRETRRGANAAGDAAGTSAAAQQQRARVQFGDAGDMMNLLFSGTFGPLTGMGGTATGAGGGATFSEWFRSMMPGGMDGGGETYEDWLNVIERMGGNVNRGGTDAEIERLPTYRFEAEAQEVGTDGAEKCAICLGEYEAGEEIKVLPCAHRFHAECVDQWLRVNRICPFCKQSIREGDGGRGGRSSSG